MSDVEAETPILWPPDAKNWLIGKDPDAGKDWGQEEKGTTKDEMVGWHHRLNGHGFGWTPGVGDGQGGLACCGLWRHKELDTNEQLNWTEQSQSHCLFLKHSRDFLGFPWGARGIEPACQCRKCKKHGFDPWDGKIHWRRAWQPTPGFLSGEYHGQRSLVGYRPWVCRELEMT